MWSGPDGPLGPAEVATEGRFAGPLANHDRYGGAYLAWFFLTGKRRLPTYFPVKRLGAITLVLLVFPAEAYPPAFRLFNRDQKLFELLKNSLYIFGIL
jgi:hypothetical protein